MTGRIVTTAQQKGGAGKTTLAAQIVVAAAEAGLRSLAIDIDPQGSLSAWGDLRARTAPAIPVDVEAAAGHRVREIASRRAGDYDLVVIDAPPHAETETRQALRAADLAIAPVQPSPLDLWASRPVIEAAEAAGADVALVLNRVPPRARIVEETAAAAVELGARLLEARLGARVIFAEAMGAGLTPVDKAPKSPAAGEVRALWREIKAILKV